jgi:hypothetical protein
MTMGSFSYMRRSTVWRVGRRRRGYHLEGRGSRIGDGGGEGRRKEVKGREGKKERTKLPANPPAINATPINKITLALHAAGPSDPHASPENAE